jgi:hypothetical protein
MLRVKFCYKNVSLNAAKTLQFNLARPQTPRLFFLHDQRRVLKNGVEA